MIYFVEFLLPNNIVPSTFKVVKYVLSACRHLSSESGVEALADSCPGPLPPDCCGRVSHVKGSTVMEVEDIVKTFHSFL